MAVLELLTIKIQQMTIESTNLQNSTDTAIVGNTVLPAGADFGNGIVLYNEDCLQALRKLNDKQFNTNDDRRTKAQ